MQQRQAARASPSQAGIRCNLGFKPSTACLSAVTAASFGAGTGKQRARRPSTAGPPLWPFPSRGDILLYMKGGAPAEYKVRQKPRPRPGGDGSVWCAASLCSRHQVHSKRASGFRIHLNPKTFDGPRLTEDFCKWACDTRAG